MRTRNCAVFNGASRRTSRAAIFSCLLLLRGSGTVDKTRALATLSSAWHSRFLTARNERDLVARNIPRVFDIRRRIHQKLEQVRNEVRRNIDVKCIEITNTRMRDLRFFVRGSNRRRLLGRRAEVMVAETSWIESTTSVMSQLSLTKWLRTEARTK